MSSADHFRDVYRHRADAYDELVRAEDHRGDLWRLLDTLVDWRGAAVVEPGAGTGRVTAGLVQRGARVLALDREPAMLRVARSNVPGGHVRWALAEHRHLPVRTGWADAAVEGWAFAHDVDWFPDRWREAADAAVAELARVVRAGGALVLVETLGTGTPDPVAPTPELAALYARWETCHGFRRYVVRTDYRFPERASAERVVGGFFGADMVERLGEGPEPVLAECTGVWWRPA